jgi:phage repressor protein C with HTH and peptisase S24 domain
LTEANRLKSIRKHLSLSQQALADSIDEKQGKIRDIETAKQKISVDFAKKIENIYNINPWWLLTGEGQMFLQNSVTDQNIAQIPFYNVEGAAGHGCLVNNEHVLEYIPFNKLYIDKVLKTYPKNLSMICINGDSMFPTLISGDIVLVDHSKSKELTDGIYVLRLDNAILVKRVQPLPDNNIKVTSDNKIYESYNLNLSTENADIIGKVVCRITNFI